MAEFARMGRRASVSIPSLIQALKDKDARVRSSAAAEISYIGAEAGVAVPALIQALKDPSGEVRSMAAGALCAIGPAAEVAVPALLEALEDDHARCNAGRALGAIGPPAAVAIPLLAKLLARSDDDEVAASWYAWSLGKLGSAAIAPLTEFVLSGTGHVRSSAAIAIGEIGPKASSAVPALIAALKGQGRPLLCYAATSLGQIGAHPECAVPALIGLLKAEDDEVRRAAVNAIGQFGPAAKVAVPEMIPMIEGKSWFRLFAAEALGNIGPGASAALDALNRLLKSKERKIRDAAELAISHIAGTPPSEALQIRISPAPDATTIDFARTKDVVVRMVAEGIANFTEEHPDVEVSCIGLFGQGFGRSATLCIETPEHSAVFVQRWAGKGWVGKDQFGQFNNNLCEFAYREYDSEYFDWWPSLYDVGSDFKIKMPNGKVVRRSTDENGNEAIDKPLFELLRKVLREARPIKGVRRAKPFRLGVEILDSGFVEFWVAKN